MKRLLGLAAVVACTLVLLPGCKPREAARARAPSGPVVEAGPPLSGHAAILATLPDGGRSRPSSAPPRTGAHEPAPPPAEGEVAYFFARCGGGVAWVASGDEKQQVVHNGRAGAAYREVDGVTLSLDGRRVAYAARVGEKWRMVLDGTEGSPFDFVEEITFSPDGRHVAYKARLGERWHLVVDSKQSAEPRAGFAAFGFSGDSTRIAFNELGADGWGRLVVSDLAFGSETVIAPRASSLLFNRARTRVAAVADGGSRKRTVTVGFDRLDQVVLGPEQDEIFNLAFGDDDVSLGYVATRSGRSYVLLDDRQAALRLDDAPVSTPIIARDRSALAMPVMSNGNGLVSVRQYFSSGAEAGRGYEGIDEAVYTADGRTLAFATHRGEAYFVVADGKEGPAFDRVVSPAFSPDGQRLVYRARKDGKRFVVVADREGKILRQDPPYEQVHPVRFTTDGKSIAYGVKDGRNLAWKVEPL